MAKKHTADPPARPDRFRDRVRELRRVRCGDIEPHPLNPRRHPARQLAAVTGLLTDVGKAAPLVAFPADGLGPKGDFSRLMYWDGHGRRAIDPDEVWPVVVTDLTRSEADEMALTGDYSATLAELDGAMVEQLMRDVQAADQDAAELIASLADEVGIIPDENGEGVELKQLDTSKPPRMAWALIGIPTIRFAEIAADIERLAAIDGTIVETTANDG